MLKVLQEYTIILGMFSELLLSNTLKNDNAKVLQEFFFYFKHLQYRDNALSTVLFSIVVFVDMHYSFVKYSLISTEYYSVKLKCTIKANNSQRCVT